MKKRSKKSVAAAGRDLISDLPDEILHSIIRRLAFSEDGEQTAQQTIALSSRWRNLWRSYPVVQLNPKTTYSTRFDDFDLSRHFYSIGSEVFQKFHDATMKKFNQDKLLRMEALKLSINIDEDDLSSSSESDDEELLDSEDEDIISPAVEQLLELASERKAEYVDIKVISIGSSLLWLPFGLLSNSSAKTLKLESIRFASGDHHLLVSLISLRSLHLISVRFDDERLFANLIASSPVLETLELKHVNGMRKLVVSNAANLKKLEIYYCDDVKEIQIAAFSLQDLHIENQVLSIGLIAPQLNVLNLHCHSQLSLSEISLDDLNHLRFLCLDNLTFDDEQVFLNWIAGRPLLETLEIRNIKNLKKLKLSNLPNLKTLVVTDCIDLKEIGLIAPQLNVLQISCCYKYNSSFCVMSCGDLNHLRSLDLGYLRFDDEQVFLNLIAGNPLLETLQLTSIKHLKKLQLSNVPNLKTVVITDCINLKEIEISAHKLHSLHLEKDFKRSKSKRMLRKIELIAPRLNDLKITNYDLRMVDLKAIVCNLQYLKSLDLFGIAGIGLRNYWMLEFSKMMEFAGRKLEEFILWVSRELKEMELDADADADAGPSVVKFLLYYDEFFDNNTIHPKLSRHLKRTMNHG